MNHNVFNVYEKLEGVKKKKKIISTYNIHCFLFNINLFGDLNTKNVGLTKNQFIWFGVFQNQLNNYDPK